jgi:hypothetical protein
MDLTFFYGPTPLRSRILKEILPAICGQSFCLCDIFGILKVIFSFHHQFLNQLTFAISLSLFDRYFIGLNRLTIYLALNIASVAVSFDHIPTYHENVCWADLQIISGVDGVILIHNFAIHNVGQTLWNGAGPKFQDTFSGVELKRTGIIWNRWQRLDYIVLDGNRCTVILLVLLECD